MLTVELGEKAVTVTSEKQRIRVNGEPLDITAKGRRVYVNGTCVNRPEWPVLELLGVGIALSTWYTMIFTDYGLQFMVWALG